MMFEWFTQSLAELPLLARFAFDDADSHSAGAVQEVTAASCGRPFGSWRHIWPAWPEVGPKHNEVAEYFAEIGKLLLMFFAGLEIDLQQFQRTHNRSLLFGLATFALPLLAGIVVGISFGYGWIGALLIDSLLASHTLLGYPIVQRSRRLTST